MNNKYFAIFSGIKKKSENYDLKYVQKSAKPKSFLDIKFSLGKMKYVEKNP